MEKNYNRNLLDIFRLVATAQVFLGHVITHFAMDADLTGPVYFFRGVPILFTLCGFLAAQSLSRYRAGEFLRRRAVRILPGFWACIGINTLMIALLYDQTPTLKEGLAYLLTQFCGLNFYTGDWLRGYGVGTPNGVLWTIGVQVQFFLLAPALYQLINRLGLSKSGIVALLLMGLSIAIEKCGTSMPELLYKLLGVTVVPYLYFLILGMIAWCFRDRIIPRLENCRYLVLVLYIGWKLCELSVPALHIFDGVLYNTVTTVLTVCLIFAFAFTGNWRMKRDLTYGFYLYHMVLINIAIHLGFRRIDFNLQGFVLLGSVTAAAVACAWLSQKFVETPAAKLAGKKEGV